MGELLAYGRRGAAWLHAEEPDRNQIKLQKLCHLTAAGGADAETSDGCAQAVGGEDTPALRSERELQRLAHITEVEVDLSILTTYRKYRVIEERDRKLLPRNIYWRIFTERCATHALAPLFWFLLVT